MNEPKRPNPCRFKYAFDVYQADDGWRWRLWTKAGKVVAMSAEPCVRSTTAIKAAEKLQDDLSSSSIFLNGKELE